MFALIFAGSVVDLRAVEFPVAAGFSWVDVSAVAPTPAVGWAYVGGVFSAPLAPPASVVPTPTQISPLAFMGRLTAAEEAAISAAALTNAALLIWLLKCAGASYIDLLDPQTKAGLDVLVAAGLLTAARETVILTP